LLAVLSTHTILIDIFPGKLGFIWLPFEIGVLTKFYRLDALSEAIQQFSNHPECVIMKITAMVMYSCVFFCSNKGLHFGQRCIMHWSSYFWSFSAGACWCCP